MKGKIAKIILTALLITSCASIPKETIVLSKTIETDLQVLQVLRNMHCNVIRMYYDKIKTDVNKYIY
jgi:starvation-inducible outer membrane lipoprotein